MDTVSEARLSLICPALARKIQSLATMLADEGIVFRVTQGLRSWSEQDKIYQQGRSTPGEIVTNASAGHSWHEFGLAVDVVLMNPTPDWDVSHPQWQRIISVGESLGLFSGSNFCHNKDNPHFQLTGILPISPNDEVRLIFRNAGMEAVWHEAGLMS